MSPVLDSCMCKNYTLRHHGLTCVPLVVLQHVDLLGKLAVTCLALVLFDAFVKLHVVPQRVFGLHTCTVKNISSLCQSFHTSGSWLILFVYSVKQKQQWWAHLSHTLHTGSPWCHRGPWGAPSACLSWRMISRICRNCDSSPLNQHTHTHTNYTPRSTS